MLYISSFSSPSSPHFWAEYIQIHSLSFSPVQNPHPFLPAPNNFPSRISTRVHHIWSSSTIHPIRSRITLVPPPTFIILLPMIPPSRAYPPTVSFNSAGCHPPPPSTLRFVMIQYLQTILTNPDTHTCYHSPRLLHPSLSPPRLFSKHTPPSAPQ